MQAQIGQKVFKNGPTITCGRQPSKNLKGYGLLKQAISHQIFYRLSSASFTWPILEYFVTNWSNFCISKKPSILAGYWIIFYFYCLCCYFSFEMMFLWYLDGWKSAGFCYPWAFHSNSYWTWIIPSVSSISW